MAFTRKRARRTNNQIAADSAKLQKLDLIKIEASKFDNRMLAEMYVYACEQQIVHNNPHYMQFMGELDQTPVSIVEFLDSEDFLGGTDLTLWPAVRDSLIEMHRDWYKGKQGGAYTEAVFAGSTGNAKTTQSIISFLYFAHIIGCLKSPQKVYGFSKSTGLTLAIFAAKPTVMKKAVYNPLRGMLDQITWFKQYMPWDESLKSEIYFFKQNTRITPAGLDADAVIGEAVIAVLIDEANFFPVVKQSKKVIALESNAAGGRTGEYDQVRVLYDTVNRRRDSRFTFQGQQLGMIIVSSSKKYVGDFTDRRIEHIRNYDQSHVYIYDKQQPDVVPQDRFCGDKFKLSVSAETNDGLVIHEDVTDVIPMDSKEYILPIEYLDKFRSDPHGSLRDVLGIASTAISPFFSNRLKILQTVDRSIRDGHESFLRQDNVNLGTYGLPMVVEDHICRNPHVPRFVHVDLSLTGDFCGIAMCHFGGMVTKVRPGDIAEVLPTVVVDMICSIAPDHANEIDIADIRSWIKTLKTQYRYPINTVTYDTFQSKESIQAWRKMGVKSGNITVDRDTKAYKAFREMLYDDRVVMYDNTILIEEMMTVEYDITKDKVDHPYGKSKDLVDAVVGSVYSMTNNPAMWVTMVNDSAIDEYADSLRTDLGDRQYGSDTQRR
ncbi:MAG: hypothetical protein DRQ39_05875 [Gammaproteobacteria bacterium]|nr:MAG: hypothetical protein DRQ39_05875 [Gammaproteobacteria bacterium]